VPASPESGGSDLDGGAVSGGRVGRGDRSGARAGGMAKVGVGLTIVSAVLLAGVAGVGFYAAVLLAGLLVLLPVLGLAQADLAQRPVPVRRMSAYASSAVTILVIGTLSFAAGMLDGGPERLGLGSVPIRTFVVSILAVLVAAVVVISGAELTRRWLGVGESALLATLLPRTPAERTAFAGLSLVAGWGEELAYRGYAIPALVVIGASPWAAAAVTSVAFGMVHAYQGTIGVARTAMLGMILAVPVVLLDSLWPSIVAHVMIDLVGGLWLGPRMLAEPAAT